MATKASSAVYAPGEDPESLKANFEYQQALKRLTDSIDQRKNRFFDPVGLAAAQGFLAPGTSNFFDALGNVAGNINKAQEAEAKEERDIAQMRLDLAGRGVEFQRQKARDAQWRSAGGEPAPQGGLAAAAQPRTLGAGSGALPSGDQGAAGPLAQTANDSAPSGFPFMPGRQGPSKQQFFAAAQMDGKTLSETIKEWEAMQKGQIEIKDKFGVNTATGRIFMLPSGNTVPTPIFREDGTVGTYPIPENVAAQLSIYLRNSDADAYFELANKYTKGPQRLTAAPQAAAPSAATPGALAVPGAPAAARPAAPVTGAPRAGAPTGMLSVDEAEAKKARERALQEAETKIEVENRQDFFQRSKDASDSITMANMLRRFSEDPNASKMVGVLSNDKVSSALALLVKEGVGSNNYRVGIPAIEKVMRNADMGPEDQAKFRVLLMNIAQMRLQLSKYMKGSVSNFEQELMGDASVTTEDTPQAIQMKADLLTRRAQFDRQANRAFKASKMTAEEFLESEQYQIMRDKYDEELASIAMGERRFQMGRRPEAAPAAAPATASASRPNTPSPRAPAGGVPGAGQPTIGFIRDPKTGMMRKIRPGE
jgi:hypothetical protein